MTESDIARIERALAIELPQAYRDALVPFRVRAYIGNSDTDLWDDAERLIELNRQLRKRDDWLSHLYAVGDAGGGDQNAINLLEPNGKPWWIDRHMESPGSGTTSETFQVWADRLIEQMRTGEYQDGFDPENDAPGTRAQFVPINWVPVLIGCAALLALATIIWFTATKA